MNRPEYQERVDDLDGQLVKSLSEMSTGTSLFDTQNVQIGFLKIDDLTRGDNSQHCILSKGPSDISSPNQPSRGVDTIVPFMISSSIQSATNLSPDSSPTRYSE
jgi:hypothetical protein